MRSDQEMFDLILDVARSDGRVRAVVMNGSRANPKAPRDIFQDFDIVYVVTEVSSFKADPTWIHRFGELMIMQRPDEMLDPPPSEHDGFAYLMQFSDGTRIDLTFHPIAKLDELRDSLSVLLLDKDGILRPFASPNESDYLPKPPTAKAFADCCNEFWWVCPYVAKGLWREDIIYAKYVLDQVLRDQLMKMLTWQIGVRTQFSSNLGIHGRYLRQFLEPELWGRLQRTYSDAGCDHTWEALDAMCQLFRMAALFVAKHFRFDYPQSDDDRVYAHLKHVRLLPRNAKEIY